MCKGKGCPSLVPRKPRHASDGNRSLTAALHDGTEFPPPYCMPSSY